MSKLPKMSGLHTISEVVSFQFQDQRWAAISVRITDKNDVYVNYLGDDKKRHTSYHGTGQKHQKVDKRHVTWTGGPSGHWEPMMQFNIKHAEVHGRESVAVWGWLIARIPEVLSLLQVPSQMNIDVAAFPQSRRHSVIGLEVSIVGSKTQERSEILDFQVLQRRRLSNGLIVVEIETFLVDEPESA